MAKAKRDSGAKKCTCNKCGLEAHSIPGKVHRRCSGNLENNTPRDKSCGIAPSERGQWN